MQKIIVKRVNFDKKMKKNIKKSKNRTIVASLIAVSVMLFIVCIVSITYNFIGGFYYSRISAYNYVLGMPQTIKIDNEGVYVAAANFSGTLVLGTSVAQQITIRNANNKLYLRAKVSLCEKDNCGILYGYTNWVQCVDGYIYLSEPIDSNQSIGLCKYVKFNDEEIKLETNLNYIATFIVEASNLPFTLPDLLL